MPNAQQPEQSVQPQPSAQPKKSSWWKWALGGCGVLIFLAIIAIAGCSFVGKKAVDEVSEGLSDFDSSSTTGINEETKIYKTGDDVTVENVRWQLIEAKDLGNVLKSDNQYTEDKKAAGNSKFVEITMEVENLDTDMASVSDLKIVDSKGREFISASDVFQWIPDDKQMFILSNLNPNVPEQFIDIYEVPEDATGLKVEVGDLNLFGNEKAYIDLGI